MLENQITEIEQDRILLPDDLLEEALPGFHAEEASLLVELQTQIYEGA